MRVALERAGNQPLEVWTRKFIIASLDARSGTPAQARNFLGTLRAIFQWALSREHIDVDPTVGIKVSRLRGDGFHTWTTEELSRFESHWHVGTRERLAFDLMLWTGLRRGDAARVGPKNVMDGSIILDTAKTGQRVSIRILPPLARSIAATPGGESFVVNDYGRPFVKESFGNWFKEACVAAGVPGSAHGLRKALAVKLAESGATDREIGAILGNDMAKLYARKASVPKLSDAALARLIADRSKTNA
jgi:integrase